MRFLSFALRPLFSGLPANIFFPMALPGNSFFSMDLRYAAASIFATEPPFCSRSATAPRPATNLIRRRKVLRFG